MIFTCDSFDGHYPVGVAAVVDAENATEAARLLQNELIGHGLPQNIDPEQMEPLSRKVTILCDGNY